MNDIKFSVLMSLYKSESEEFLDDCFSSIYEQTLPANEITLVIDGPIPNSLENVVIKWMGFLPINVVRLEKNVGLGQALNYGVKACSNDIIIRMDTDDICKKNRFETLVRKLDSNNKLAVVGSYIEEFVHDPGNVISIRTVPLDTESIRKDILIRNPFNHMSVAFRKKNIESVGGYVHHYFMEDYNLWLRVVASGFDVCNLNESLILARVGDNMLARRKGLKYIKSEFQLYRLKVKLGLQSHVSGFWILLVRSIPRLLPLKVLKYVYQYIRR
ncbi:glycosyltransferase [Escherichia albertii]|nr:glycosyltransferase [Escherichia albertii]EHX2146160.1 glycosyltransferase [Escherichia albertii]